ncbi:MAG TPA: DUF169 domain-containing protein [Chloroflexota bacterium]|nr:DUF169 domain-containing protein [Chloroflexota bacterium]
MIDLAALSKLLVETLDLSTPPVGLRFVEQAPAGMVTFEGEVPSACSFWRRAEQGMFYADAPAHFNCLVGTHTMGLPMPEEKGPELMALIGQMHDHQYFDPAEVPHVPTVPGAKSGIVYGPLADFSDAPDAVLVWLTPYQSMLLQEASGTAAWSEQPGIPTFGRPSCAAIPVALSRGVATQSLGCMGMRVFTEIAQDRLLGVLPRQHLEELPGALQRVADANEKMGQHYRGQKAIHTKGSGSRVQGLAVDA